MKSKWLFAFNVILIVGIAFAVGYRQASGRNEITAGPVYPDANVGSAFNFQGAIREGGKPVTGTRSMTFKLYPSTGCTGTVLQTIGPTNVTVTNGLFSIPLSFTASHFEGQALSLGMTISGTGSGCTTLLAVPYALSLRPGGAIRGEINQWAVLTVDNQGTSDIYSDGLYGISHAAGSAGVVGQAGNADGYGVRGISNGIAVRAEGSIWSDQDTVLVLSPHGLVARNETLNLLEFRPQDTGAMFIHSPGAGVRYVSLPVQLPGILFGTHFYVKSLEVCYKTGAATNWVDAAAVIAHKKITPFYEIYAMDSTPHNNTTEQCYTANAAPLRWIEDSTWVQFNLNSTSPLASWIIYTIKLTITQNNP